MTRDENALEDPRELREEISFTEEEIAEMMKESREAWRRRPTE